MPRPRQCRYVSASPSVTYFKPRGIPLTALEEACLSVEGLEALRLADMEGLTAIEAARHMRISRHSFGRTLAAARRTVATALWRGQACVSRAAPTPWRAPARRRQTRRKSRCRR